MTGTKRSTRNLPCCGRSIQRFHAQWLLAAFVLLAGALWLRADQLEMLNGDHYTGKVLSLTSNTVVWQSEVLGTVNLPREKVGSINLGSAAAALSIGLQSNNPPIRSSGTNRPATSSNHPSNDPAIQSPDLRQLRGNSNLIQQV